MKRVKEIKSFAMSKYTVMTKKDSNYKEYMAFISGVKYADSHPKNLWRDAKKKIHLKIVNMIGFLHKFKKIMDIYGYLKLLNTMKI